MSKTRQWLKILNGWNLDAVQEFWDSSGFFDRIEEKFLNFYFFVNSF